MGRTLERGREKATLPADPCTATRWYRRLPPEQRGEMRRQWQAIQERKEELQRDARQMRLNDACALAAVYLVGDVICPGGSWWTIAVATLLGALLGWSFSRFQADRLITGGVGVGVFLVFEWASYAGLRSLHLYVFVLVGIACAYLGMRREERAIG